MPLPSQAYAHRTLIGFSILVQDPLELLRYLFRNRIHTYPPDHAVVVGRHTSVLVLAQAPSSPTHTPSPD
ncbi:MAG: hypothetical protein RMJ46_00790 [Bacteroidota bacterium]|nr:hypothetical protein [Bacteroidota bacterium]